MHEPLGTLLELQKRHFAARRPAATSDAEVNALRARVPAAVLKHFDRLIARGKKAVVLVTHGVCGGCHLQVTRGTFVDMTHQDSLPKCGSCGRFLYLPESELAEARSAVPNPAPAGRSAQPRGAHAG